MAEETPPPKGPTRRSAARKPAAPRGPGRAKASAPAAPAAPAKPARGRAAAKPPAAPAAAPLAATEAIEGAARDAVTRMSVQLADALRTAQEAADRAAGDLPALFSQQIKAAEAEAQRMADAIAEQLITGLKTQLDAAVSSAQESADRTARQVGDQFAEQTRLAERSIAALREQAEANLVRIEEAGSQAAQARQVALAGAGAAGASVIEGLALAQKHVAEFVGERIRHDIAAQTALLGCRSLEDVREVQASFFQTAMTQYSEEASRLMHLGGELARRALDRRDD